MKLKNKNALIKNVKMKNVKNKKNKKKKNDLIFNGKNTSYI